MPQPKTRRSFLKTAALLVATFTVDRQSLARVAAASPLPSSMELALSFTIAPPSSGGRYNRPYVAAWIEDASGKPVRTLSVWANTSGRGLRYLNELRRWFSQSSALLPTVSSPTRNPGSYTLTWDGKTDKGGAAAQGNYVVCLELAREHGPYGLLRSPITLGSAPQKKQLDISALSDLSSAALDYRKKA